jgi:hypothetical protein
MKEIKLSELKMKYPKPHKKQTPQQKKRRQIENGITVYDTYDESNGIYGKTPPTVITEK